MLVLCFGLRVIFYSILQQLSQFSFFQASFRIMLPKWSFKAFAELTTFELYEILQARQAVFIVEQKCPYLDADGIDQLSHHLAGWDSDKRLLAYCRLVPPCVKYEEPSIGRVITLAQVRRKGYGKLLMTEAIQRSQHLYPNMPIRIGAQLYLERFYNAFGFVRCSAPYDEDGIPHIQMLLTP